MNLDFYPLREQILSRLTISELAQEYGLSPKGLGDWKNCHCPWHEDKHPSLGFHDRSATFKCFAASCARHGSLFDLMMLQENLSFFQAFSKLTKRFNLSLPSSNHLETQWDEERKKIETLTHLFSWMKDQLFSSNSALSYLKTTRGYNDELIQKLSDTLHFGFLSQNPLKFLKTITSDLEARHLTQTLRPLIGRIAGPWYDLHGQLSGFWGRAIDTKEPKYLYSKGLKKTTPYLLHLAKRSSSKTPFLCLVEGILDASIPQALGFSSIAATGGTVLPNKQQLQLIKDSGFRVLVLLPDSDEPGQQSLLKGAKTLLHNLSSLKMELLIANLPSNLGKDLDAVLSKSDKPLDSLHQITSNATPLHQWLDIYSQQQQKNASSPLQAALIRSQTTEIQHSLEPHSSLQLLGIGHPSENLLVPENGWIIPEGWELDNQGIYRLSQTQEGEEKRQRIARSPVIVSARSVNIDSNHEQLEVSFARDQSLQKIWADRADLLNHRSLVVLANQGFPVTSRNSTHLVDYLADFEADNLPHLAGLHTVSSFGWKRHKGELFFVLGDRSIGTSRKILFLPDGEGERNFAKALKTKGTLEGWLQLVRKARPYTRALFALYAGFTPPLLPLLDFPSFSIDFCGDSSTGKTTIIFIPASIFGDPVGDRGGIVPSWNATSVSIERYASLFKSLPIFLDDSHLATTEQVKSVIYMLSGGTGKMRGSLKGSQSLSAWHTVGFFTGERPVISVTTHEGARARVIEFHGSPFPNASGQFVSDLKTGFSNHFGHAGPLFLEHLIQILRDKSEDFKSKTESHSKMLKNLAPSGVDNRRASYFAAVWTAAELVEDLFKIGGEPNILIPKIFEEICGEGSSFAQKAMESISSWVMANWNSFDTGKGAISGEVYGIIKTGEYVAIFPHKLTDFLSKNGYSYEAVMRAFRDRDWIEIDGKSLTTKIRYQGSRTRMVKIFWNYVSL